MALSPKRLEILVGFFLFVGLSLLGALILQYGRLVDRFRGVYTVNVSFRDASGVIKGSQVRLAGARIGKVMEEPELRTLRSAGGMDEARVVVKLAIRNDAPPIDRNATFQITSLSLLGDKAIMITPPRGGEESAGILLENLEPDIILEGGGPSGLEALQSDAENIASDAAVLMARARTTLSKIDNALDEMRTVSGLLSESLDRVNGGLLSDENMENFSGALADLRGASGNIREASLDIKPLIAEARTAVESFDQAAEEAQGTFARASSEIGKLGPALEKVPAAVDSIARVADDAGETLQSIRKSEGLLGTLAYDREVKDDAKTFLRNLRHYGILRYRDAGTFDERDPRNRFRGRRR
ncbi:MAG: MCE family protein [Akkermansiaceae bacterium]|nr:MCE family protein [Akkermansiaceae bacterium]